MTSQEFGKMSPAPLTTIQRRRIMVDMNTADVKTSARIEDLLKPYPDRAEALSMNVDRIIHPIRTRRNRRIADEANSFVPDAETVARWEAEDLHVAEFLAANPDVAAKIARMKLEAVAA